MKIKCTLLYRDSDLHDMCFERTHQSFAVGQFYDTPLHPRMVSVSFLFIASINSTQK